MTIYVKTPRPPLTRPLFLVANILFVRRLLQLGMEVIFKIKWLHCDRKAAQHAEK